MRSKLILALLADRSGDARRRQAGFALLLSLIVGLAVLVGWLMLAARTSSSRLGAALQSENREARLVAESAVDVVINELNQPRNRMLLAYGKDLAKDWQNPAPLRNPCSVPDEKGNLQLNPPPSDIITQLGKKEYIDLPAIAVNDRFSRRFRLMNVTLKNSKRQSGNDYAPGDINLRQPGAWGYIELEVEGQVLRNGVPAATTRITREYQVVPKCCNRSFRGPGDPELPRDPITNLRPGLYGNDDRPCGEGFPQFLVGTGNNAERSTGGLSFTNTPEIRSRENPAERPDQILCFTKTNTCGGVSSADNVPVLPTDRFVPKAPVLGPDGVPCSEDHLSAQDYLTCIRDGIEKARKGGFTARPIDLITQNDRDYIRVNKDGKVEICNKSSTPFYVNTWSSLTKAQRDATKKFFDPSTTIVNGSCELMMDNSDASKNVCAEQEINGFKTYHCRIRNIYVNDTGADLNGEAQVRQNNTLFIDSSNAPIYLYVNEDWAATSVNQASAAVQQNEVKNKGTKTHDNYQAIFTPGRWDDGQIQHVYCGPVNGMTTPSGNEACAVTAPAAITSRAAIVSACRRRFDQVLGKAEEDCIGPNNTNTVNMIIGDDGFVRDLFLFMPNSTLTISGDPHKQDLAQGKPQVAAVVWVDNLKFTNRTTQLYVPGENAEFFGLETSPDDRYAPIIFDYIARSITSSFLFRR